MARYGMEPPTRSLHDELVQLEEQLAYLRATWEMVALGTWNSAIVRSLIADVERLITVVAALDAPEVGCQLRVLQQHLAVMSAGLQQPTARQCQAMHRDLARVSQTLACCIRAWHGLSAPQDGGWAT